MPEESEGHWTDEDGLCGFSDLPPSQCAGHFARPALTGWGLL